MDSIPNNRFIELQKRINQYGMRFPVATIVKETGLNKGYVSAVINGKKPISDNFWDTFNKKFPEKPSPNGQQKTNDLLTGAHITLQDYINEIKHSRDMLFTLVNSGFGKMFDGQRLATAYQKAWIEYEAERAAQGDSDKKEEIMYKMGKLVDEYLHRETLFDIRGESDKNRKA